MENILQTKLDNGRNGGERGVYWLEIEAANAVFSDKLPYNGWIKLLEYLGIGMWLKSKKRDEKAFWGTSIISRIRPILPNGIPLHFRLDLASIYKAY